MIKFYIGLMLLINAHLSIGADLPSDNRFKILMSVGKPADRLVVKNEDQNEITTDFDQIEFRPTVVYFLTDRIGVGAYYFQKTMLADFDSNGLGGFARYYFMNDGTISHTKFENKTITLSPTWTPYFELGVKEERLEAGAVSISFSGLEVAAGVDWHLRGDYFLNFVVYGSYQLAGENRSLTSTSFLLGIGKAFSM